MQAFREERTDNHQHLDDSLLEQPVNWKNFNFQKSYFNLRTRLTDLVLSFVNRYLLEGTKSFVTLLISPHFELIDVMWLRLCPMALTIGTSSLSSLIVSGGGITLLSSNSETTVAGRYAF